MKKRKTVFLLLIITLLFTGCSGGYSAKQMAKDMDEKESFIVYFGNDQCPACVDFAPTVRTINEDYEDIIKYIDTVEDKSDDIKKLVTEYGVNLKYTPTIFIIKNGEVIDEKVGVMKYSELEEVILISGLVEKENNAEQ